MQFRKVTPDDQQALGHLMDDEGEDAEPPLRLYVEHELPKSLFDHQSVNGEMHKDVRQVFTPTAARSEQLNGGVGMPAPMMNYPAAHHHGGASGNHPNLRML